MATTSSRSEAAKKRSIARRFNDSLLGRTARAAAKKTTDRRTERRLRRYREELKSGVRKGGKPLTPLDIVTRVDELLKHGERMTDIRALMKQRVVDYDEEKLVTVLKEMKEHYDFRPEAYRHAGVKNESLVAAGILDSMPARRGPIPGAKAKKAAEQKAAEEEKAGEKKAPAKKSGRGRRSSKK